MQEKTRGPQRHSTSAARDQTEGQMRETRGRVKERLGTLTGNERLRAEGQRDQMAGASRRKKGQWKERLKAWIDRLEYNVKISAEVSSTANVPSMAPTNLHLIP